MTKRMSSKLVDARTLASYELDKFIDYIHSVEPRLSLDQTTVLAPFALHDLPQLFQINPPLLDQLKLVATDIHKKRKCARAPIVVNEVRLSNGGNN
ncbi:hypothetical protein [Nostoc sp.]|uniref:hypothetical protein n=1 Tax=Nostoc sp. TaxID=1180 RepID=UPI002FFB942D